jgi:hypothetical protein
MNNTPDQTPTESETSMTDNNMLSDIAETINQEFTARIQDGVFIIEPAEAGVAMFAALANQEDEAARAWVEADVLVTKLEALREENASYREHLEKLQFLLDAIGYDDKVQEIDELLWPVVGVLEDGTEVSFEYFPDVEPNCEDAQ